MDKDKPIDNNKRIETLFQIDSVSNISETDDPNVGEAAIGYIFAFNTSIPELAFSFAEFLKALDKDGDAVKQVDKSQFNKPGSAFIALLKQYYELTTAVSE